jgi:hypothetical protein
MAYLPWPRHASFEPAVFLPVWFFGSNGRPLAFGRYERRQLGLFHRHRRLSPQGGGINEF